LVRLRPHLPLQSCPGVTILIDQSDADAFLTEQLQPEKFAAASAAVNHPLTLRLQPGYDHSYYFIATFMGDHLAHHAAALG
jgi:S-formylglutathione hydrolase